MLSLLVFYLYYYWVSPFKHKMDETINKPALEFLSKVNKVHKLQNIKYLCIKPKSKIGGLKVRNN